MNSASIPIDFASAEVDRVETEPPDAEAVDFELIAPVSADSELPGFALAAVGRSAPVPIELESADFESPGFE